MEKIAIKETLESELKELAKRSQMTYERTNNLYHKGKMEAYQTALEMVQSEIV